MIRSKSKLLWIALLMVVFMVASATMASAAVGEPVLEMVNMDYTGTTQEAAEQTLQEAMAKVEEGKNVTLTLKSDMDFYSDNDKGYILEIGTDTESEGTLYIQSELSSGAPLYGITLNRYYNLLFKGNVTFTNIILDRNTTEAVSYYSGSYIIIHEGKGVIGDKADTTKWGNVCNPLEANRASLISVVGTDLEVYSGYYNSVGANSRATKMSVGDANIIFGGNAKAEAVAGRGIYTEGSAKVTGKTTLTIKDSAHITSYATAGHYRPVTNAAAALGGDATLNLQGGKVNNLAYAGACRNGGKGGALYNKDANNTKSVYTINLTGGRIMGSASVYFMDSATSNDTCVKYLDVTVNINGVQIDETKYVYGGVYLNVRDASGTYLPVSGFEFSESNVNINIHNATFPKSSGFFAGSFFANENTDAEHPNVDNVTRTIDIKNSTFSASYIVFGSRFDRKVNGTPIVAYCDHQGKTTITAEALSGSGELIQFGSAEFYAGSYLAAQNSMHSGETVLTIKGVDATFKAGNATKHAGSSFRANNTSHTGKTTATYDLAGANVYVGYTSPIFALHKVNAGLTGVSIAGSATTKFVSRVHCGGLIFGGSVLESPVTNTGSTVLEISDATTYGGTTQSTFYGGDCIKHTGENNDSTAKCELKIKSLANNVNDVDVHFIGGSRIEKAGKTSINSKTTIDVDVVAAKLLRPAFGGSEILAAGEHKGTSELLLSTNSDKYVQGRLDLFGGSRLLVAGAKHSGSSKVSIPNGSPIIWDQTTQAEKDGAGEGVTDNVTIFGGSDLGVDGTEHSGSSIIVLGTAEKYPTTRSDMFGGSKITAAATHSGSSELQFKNALVQNQAFMFGGSYLANAKAVQSGPSKFNIIKREGNSSGPAGFYGGSYIAVDGAKQTGSATMILEEGELSCIFGAGSYAAVAITDTNKNDIIPAGFCQGDVYFIVNGGKVTPSAANTHIAGFNANVDGDVHVIINGGTINSALFTLTGSSSNTVAVSGDSILKIYGGTFKGQNIVNGAGNSSSTKAQGINAVLGCYYTEFANDGKGEEIVFNYLPNGAVSPVYIEPAGRGVTADYTTSSCYVRFVGDIPMTNEDGTFLVAWNFSSRLGYVATRYIDYAQYTTTGDTAKMLGVGSFNKILRHVKGNRFLIKNYDSATAKLGDLKSAEGMTFNWWSDYTYADLVAYDSYTEFKNAPVFVDGTSHKQLTNGIGINTASVKLKVGSVYSNAFAITSAEIAAAKQAAADNTVAKYGLVGSSIRLSNLAMRCRAKIHKDFFNGIESANDMGGYKVYKMGILVGKNAGEAYEIGDANVSDAVAFENGQFKAFESWAEGEDVDYYYFAAAITGYEDAATFATRANTTIYFRAYIILEDANGVQNVIYINSPVENAGAVNYAKSFVDAAADAKATAWYEGLTADNKKKVDDIIAAKA